MLQSITTDIEQYPRLTPKIVNDSVFFDREQCRLLGDSLNSEYVNNKPYPHIVIDNFLPAEILRRVLNEFPKRVTGRFNDDHSRLKTGYQLEKIESPFITNLIYALNSSAFLDFLERLTGIKRLVTDPHQAGGGLHETARGGHLSIHADFNMHPNLGVRRRMNLIIFLNENWMEEYGGALELWETDMSKKARAVLPIIGRAVVFNTESNTFHGHPDPLQCPEGTFRRSLALYYYSVPEDVSKTERAHTTDFRRRPGSSDKIQVKSKVRELFVDLIPPLIYRSFKRNR
ncbi:MAG: 2OG-Fe(II) oxygenase [Pirellula sp.]|jgi:Rps23 Pro-64 3,4-dihydroxylase Tpa1-like proline 4-hydroxylase